MTLTRRALGGLLALTLALGSGAASAQGVVLSGRMGDRALFVVDGQTVTLRPGERRDGLRLLGWAGDEAEVEVAGQRARLRVGGTPTLVGGAVPKAAAREIVVSAGPGGHFTPAGAINGRPVRFMVDTGATLVALGRDEALRLGLDLSGARVGTSQTANGPVPVQIIVLERVRVGEVEILQVGAAVMPQPMPYVLLGNSFLSRFQMRRDNDVMRLELR
jgi:aspartyl protease family protein